MAVLNPNDELDVALDKLGAIIADAAVDALVDASRIAGLWRQVFARAMDRGDYRLARVAAEQWCNSTSVIRALASTTSPPSPD